MKTAIMIAVLCAAILLPTCATADAEPDRVLFYYGWPSSFNYPTNQWSIERVAEDMGQYDLVVLGGGLEATTHPDHTNTENIIQMLPDTLVFGYVDITSGYTVVCDKITQWNAMGADGIFFDMAGYDYAEYDHGTTRRNFNYLVWYTHEQSSANTAFVNAWVPDHVMGTNNDVSYPNRIYNRWNLESALGEGDYYLLESCPIYHNTLLMSPYHVAKCERCVVLRDLYDVKLVAVSTIGNTHPTGQTLYNQHVSISDLYGFDAQGTSDIWYGAGSSQVKMWS